MDRGAFAFGIVIIIFGIFVSTGWEINLANGSTDYFFFPWGLILLIIGAWLVYISFKIKPEPASPKQTEYSIDQTSQ